MKTTIKRLDTSLPLPEYQTPGAVAFDILARETTIIPPRGIGRVPGNVIIKVPEGYVLMLKDRSSTPKKKGLIAILGFIDQDYCGETDEILVQYFNFQDTPVSVERGERLAQAAFVKIDRAEWVEVATMSGPARGGFGSTGS
jgi:dUTP pyrophosphatase